MKKNILLFSACLTGLSLGSQSAHAQNGISPVSTGELEQCFGIQKCAGQNSCSISKEEIASLSGRYKNKFKHAEVFDCGGSVKGSAQKGYLAWVNVAKGSCLRIQNGFLIENKKVIDK